MRWLVALLGIAALAPLPFPPLSTTVAQAPTCSDSLLQGMAFLRGHWAGESYSVAGADTTLDATMYIDSEPLQIGCGLDERWRAVQNGKPLFHARVLRAYDAPSRRWLVYYVDDQVNSQFYEGRLDGAQWRFLRTRLDRGVPIQVRLTWRATSQGYEELIERSRNGGVTWVLGGFVSFRPAPIAPGQ